MKIQTSKISLKAVSPTLWVLSAIIPSIKVDELNKLVNKDKPKIIDIKVKSEKRSLDSNAYCWVLINKISTKLNTTDMEIYLKMLERYGTCEYIACMANMVDTLRKLPELRIVDVVSENTSINDKDGVTVKLVRGSSTYTQAEMSKLINGIVQDAQELGIETKTPDELKQLINSWGGVK